MASELLKSTLVAITTADSAHNSARKRAEEARMGLHQVVMRYLEREFVTVPCTWETRFSREGWEEKLHEGLEAASCEGLM